MTYHYHLSPSLGSCPDPWQKLIRYLQDGSDGAVDHSLIQQSLKPYHGVYIHTRYETPFIEFNREEDASAFVLRWA